ncbi:TetR/AcrR family transcriptional regulator [Actinomadura hibisca]|uniref:TetR/AcrR family transcriptional regulator n=1 Tax=Actinomadura hibisca TaxID=68565 RepID=UPI000830D781|nr:TetR/AcrR family transcriptional regulator [Actinomadura hibisca]
MPPRGDKRAAILAGALAVFARDGYTRAGIDAIAAEAGVSTRTIYNHFADKAALFQAAIEASTARVAEAQIAVIDRHLHKIVDLERDLVAFGRDWVRPMPQFAEHTALVRQVNTEIAHIPADVVASWQRDGPLRVRREMAAHLRRMADEGLLTVDDAERSALQLMMLVSVVNPSLPSGATPEETDAAVVAGVHTFLYGHAR